jgi:nucleoporin POM152
MKLWDVLAPHFADLPPALSSSLRVRGPISAAAWGVAELLGLSALSLLRIPGMSPSKKNIVFIVLVLVVWNVVCWFLADVSTKTLSTR